MAAPPAEPAAPALETLSGRWSANLSDFPARSPELNREDDPDARCRPAPQTPLQDHPVFSIPRIGAPYRFGLWYQDRASLKGYAFEARIALKSLARRGNPRKFLILGRPRSGTTLLQRLLNQVEGLRCDGEVLHHAVLRPVDFLDRHARTRDTVIAGAKIISYLLDAPRIFWLYWRDG